jgi:hypothetical protein
VRYLSDVRYLDDAFDAQPFQLRIIASHHFARYWGGMLAEQR